MCRWYSSSNVIVIMVIMGRTGSRGKISRRKTHLAAEPHLAAKSPFLLQNVRGSSTAHTAVKVTRRRIQRTLARKEMLRNTPEARENAPSNCAHNSTILHS